MINFSISIYKREHGKQPRGLGHWGFYANIKDEELTKRNCPFEHYKDTTRGLVIIWASKVMTLTDAKKEVGGWFKDNGFRGTLAIAD